MPNYDATVVCHHNIRVSGLFWWPAVCHHNIWVLGKWAILVTCIMSPQHMGKWAILVTFSLSPQHQGAIWVTCSMSPQHKGAILVTFSTFMSPQHKGAILDKTYCKGTFLGNLHYFTKTYEELFGGPAALQSPIPTTNSPRWAMMQNQKCWKFFVGNTRKYGKDANPFEKSSQSREAKAFQGRAPNKSVNSNNMGDRR